jgi:predicted nucleic acid-binding protein
MTEEEMEDELIKRFGVPIEIDVPPIERLKEKYTIRDDDDYKILYSAERTRSKIIVTRDKDFFDLAIRGPKGIKIINIDEYVGKKQTYRKKNENLFK